MRASDADVGRSSGVSAVQWSTSSLNSCENESSFCSSGRPRIAVTYVRKVRRSNVMDRAYLVDARKPFVIWY